MRKMRREPNKEEGVGEVIPWGRFQSREPGNQSLEFVLLSNEFSEGGGGGEGVTLDEMKNF